MAEHIPQLGSIAKGTAKRSNYEKIFLEHLLSITISPLVAMVATVKETTMNTKQIAKAQSTAVDVKRSYTEIAAEYAPYNTMPEFQRAAQDYMDRIARNMGNGVAAQAYDRGLEAAMRYVRQFQ